MATRKSLDQIRFELREMLPDLQAKYGVESLWVFGSTALGTAHTESDVDLLVDLNSQHLSLYGFVRLENELSDRLGLPVDLVERVALHRGLRDSVLPFAVRV